MQKTAAKIGFWSALLVAALNVAYFIAFIQYLPALNAPWPGLAAYAAAFRPLPFLAWVVPCFFLPLVFLTMIACLYICTEEAKKIWSLLALAFATVYAAVLSTNYFIQMTVVSHNLVTKTTEGLSLWLYAYNLPYNIPLALEGVGYGFMGISVLFAALVFGRGKLQQWVRWTFVGFAISGLVLPISLLVALPGIIIPISLGVNGLLLTLAPVLLAIVFKRAGTVKCIIKQTCC